MTYNEKSILIIDDEQGYRDFYKFVLEPLGYEVFAAVDGATGLEMALERPYVTIFLDVHLPKMRGPEVLEKIKKVRPDQNVIIFSSSSDPSFDFETRAKDMGAFDCLYKPVDVETIFALLDRVCTNPPGSSCGE
jgi:DNA-binding NtrC family response regulator